ncbi:translation elongation factor P [candidate division WOR-3 bacterium]|nr:translation elongation factor P [candidate division WOR-3 bacterium]
MVKASELRNGACIRLNGELYKVLLAELKAGTAKLPSSVHVRLRSISAGTQTEQRLHPEAKVEDIMVETILLTYSYRDGDTHYFMHPMTFDQVGIPRRMVAAFEKFLGDGSVLKVEFYGEQPIDVVIPATVEMTVAATGPPLHGDVAAAPKAAVLENGMEVQVPQFIKTHDRIKLDVATGRYLERIR